MCLNHLPPHWRARFNQNRALQRGSLLDIVFSIEKNACVSLKVSWVSWIYSVLDRSDVFNVPKQTIIAGTEICDAVQ